LETLERYSQNQRIIDEYTARTLAGIPGELGRLVSVALLRNVSTGRYSEPTLERRYSEGAVHEALVFCHEELFEKYLESPLENQEKDLRNWFASLASSPSEIAHRWLEVEFFRLLVPQAAPPYLRDLFFSNLRVLLTVVASERLVEHANP